jgi:hypothetical protein
VLENIRDVFQFHKKHEEYLHHTRSGNDVLVLHDYFSDREYKGIFEMLTERHIPFDVMEYWCMGQKNTPRSLESYKLVVLPDISRLSDTQCGQLDRYVENGGKLLVTGFTSTRDESGAALEKIRLASLGVEPKYKAFEKVQGTYFRIFNTDKKKLGEETFRDLDLVYAWEEGLLCNMTRQAKGYLGYIPPAMIGPPEKCYYTEVTEIPGLIHNRYGQGQTAFFPFRIGSLYHHKRHYGHAGLVMAALSNLLTYEPDLRLEASPMVEVSRQIGNEDTFEWYALLNHTGQMGNGFFEPVPIRNIPFKFKPLKDVVSVKSLRTGRHLPFVIEDTEIALTVPELASYDVLLVEYDLFK